MYRLRCLVCAFVCHVVGCAPSDLSETALEDSDVSPPADVRLVPASAWCAAGAPVGDLGNGISGIQCVAPLDIATGTSAREGVTWEAGPIEPVGQ